MTESCKEEVPSRTFVCTTGPHPGSNFLAGPENRFTLIASDHAALEKILTSDIFSLATAFINGEFTVRGDIFSAIRFFRNRQHSPVAQWWFALASLLQCASDSFGGRKSARLNIRFHYDRSNEFYSQFLDSRMVYSAAYFNSHDETLEQAQVEKLQRICRALDVRPGQRFLDIGCGWGALVVHAAEQFHVNATGCTLSQKQLQYARRIVRERGLEGRVTILDCDYRDLEGRFDRIASIGMFEHVGQGHLAEYFRKVHSLLEEDGLFLNSGIVRPETVSDDAETLFIQRSVFPGGRLAHLADIFRQAERAGLRVLEMQDLRQHYALTCRAWVNRLQQNAAECIRLVGEITYRTWLLYLAGSVVNFEDAQSDIAQLTFAKAPRPHA